MMVGKNADYATNVTVNDEKDADVNGSMTVLSGNCGGNSLEPATRSANALWKRAEQLKRWEESETNRENPNPVRGGVAVSWSMLGGHRAKVKFPDECVFLAACASGDIDEVERLLEHGADINTTNVDGMTALHQAVIDQNLDVVQYLVENGADIDAQDNEGWTPLMAGVSCDFIDIVRYLLDKGADPSLVNSDGELPLDLTDSPQMRSILEQEISRRGIDLEDARHREEQLMMRDALELLNSRSSTKEKDKRHPRTGATALHVSAAKGYIKVLNILLQAGCDVNVVDFEGWTPLHAAAHWGERQACEILSENMANMDLVNNAKQTCFDLADSDELCQALEEIKKKQEQIQKERKTFEPLIEQNAPSRQLQEYKVRKNSVTRLSTDSKKNITKSDETKEAEALRTASSSEASDNELDEKKVIVVEAALGVTSPTSTTPVIPAKPSPPATTERKRQEVVQPTAAPPKLPKLDSKEKVTVTTAALSATSPAITTAAGSPLASVSVTVVQPSRTRQTTAMTTSSTATTPATGTDATTTASKSEERKPSLPSAQSNNRPTRGPPIIVPSEPSTPPWRLTGRRGIQTPVTLGGATSENGSAASATTRTSSPQSPAVVSVQVTSSTAPTPSRVTVVGNAAASSASSPASESVRWRSGRLEKNASVDDIVEKSCSKLPWATRSLNPPPVSSPPWSHLIKKRFANSASSSPVNPSSPVVSPPPGIDKMNAFTFRTHVLSPPPNLQPMVAAWTPPLSFAQQTSKNVPTKSSSWAPLLRNAISEQNSSSPFRSFTPPQRSEESEAERKVRAKRERETRRSTQGVTLETVKLAEQIHGSDGKKVTSSASEDEKGKFTLGQGHKIGDSKETAVGTTKPTVTRPSTIEIGGSAKAAGFAASSLYPWRSAGRASQSDSGSDTAKPELLTPTTEKSYSKQAAANTPPSPFFKRFQTAGRGGQEETATKDSSSTLTTTTSPATTAVETSSPSAVAAAAVSANIPNRKRLRNTRRSTGPVAQEDVQLALETDQQGQMTGEDDSSSSASSKSNTILLGGSGDQKQKPSKLNIGPTVIPVGGASPNADRKSALISDGASEQQTPLSHRTTSRHPSTKSDSPPTKSLSTNSTSADVNYKKLYEQEKVENDRLLEKIKYLESLIESTRMIGSKSGSGDTGQTLNERERKALEKRISQLEDDTKSVDQLRADNQRLKEENGALIRVISKLSK